MQFILNPHCEVVPISARSFAVRGGPLDNYSIVVDAAASEVSAAALVDRLGSAFDAEALTPLVGVEPVDAEAWVAELRSAGVVVAHDAPAQAVEDWVAFARYGALPRQGTVRTVELVGEGRLAAGLAESLGRFGVPVVRVTDPPAYDGTRDRLQVDTAGRDDDLGADEPTTPEAVRVLASDSSTFSEQLELNAQYIAARASALYVTCSGVEWCVGPYVVPGATACFWEYERLHARTIESPIEYHTMAYVSSTQFGPPQVTLDAAVAAAVPHVLELAMTGQSDLAGAILRGRSTTGITERSSVMRLPRCPHCLPLRPILRNPLW
jgi:bacteriocin biosynthesis cyclodehydratase domain-containing protein